MRQPRERSLHPTRHILRLKQKINNESTRYSQAESARSNTLASYPGNPWTRCLVWQQSTTAIACKKDTEHHYTLCLPLAILHGEELHWLATSWKQMTWQDACLGQGHLETVQSAQNPSVLCLPQSILKLTVAALKHFAYGALACCSHPDALRQPCVESNFQRGAILAILHAGCPSVQACIGCYQAPGVMQRHRKRLSKRLDTWSQDFTKIPWACYQTRFERSKDRNPKALTNPILT